MPASRSVNRSLVAGLASYLDEMSSDYPVLALSESGARLVAGYAHVEVDVHIERNCEATRRSDADANRFIAPSLAAALDFTVPVEAMRQVSAFPFLQFQAELGAS